MASNWFYADSGKDPQQRGPISSEELRGRARSGMLKPDDLVWKEGMQNWLAARKVKGLFLDPTPRVPLQSVPPPPIPPQLPRADQSNHREPSATSIKIWESPYLIGALTVLCFPIGLYLVWRHPTWSKRRKWVWTGACAGIVLLGMASADDPESEPTQLRDSSAAPANGGSGSESARDTAWQNVKAAVIVDDNRRIDVARLETGSVMPYSEVIALMGAPDHVYTPNGNRPTTYAGWNASDGQVYTAVFGKGNLMFALECSSVERFYAAAKAAERAATGQ